MICTGLIGAFVARIEHRRLDAVAIRHRIGGLAPAAAVGLQIDVLHDRLRIVARAYDQRDAQREGAGGLLHRRLIFELHQDGFAGRDIGDRVGEDVRPLLLDQRGLVTGGLGLFVDRARGLPLLDLADRRCARRSPSSASRPRRLPAADRHRPPRPSPGVLFWKIWVTRPRMVGPADGQVIVGAEPRRFGVIALLAGPDQQ